MNDIDLDLDLPPAAAPQTLNLAPAPTQPSGEAAIARATESLVARAKALQVDSPESFELAGEMIDRLKATKKDVVGFFEPLVDAAHKAWKTLTARRATFTDPLDEALLILQGRYGAYAKQVREEAERERRRLEKEAQEREQARLRAEAEAREKAAQEAAQAAAQATSADEAAVLTQQAEDLTVQAEDARIQAATVQAPVFAPLPTVVDMSKGPTIRAKWTFRVTDKMALIKAVAAGQVSHEAIKVDEAYLRKRAAADKDTAQIPGVQVYDEGTVVASRGGRR